MDFLEWLYGEITDSEFYPKEVLNQIDELIGETWSRINNILADTDTSTYKEIPDIAGEAICTGEMIGFKAGFLVAKRLLKL